MLFHLLVPHIHAVLAAAAAGASTAGLSLSPNASAPGIGAIQSIINSVAGWGKLAALLATVIGAGIYGLSRNDGRLAHLGHAGHNYIVKGLMGAALLGLAPTLVSWALSV